MGSQSSRRPVTTQVASWVVNVLTEMLDVDERQIARGDVAESGVTGNQAVRDVFGLVIRRQFDQWTHWQPWITVVVLILPLTMILSIVSGRTAGMSSVYLWMYANNWHWSDVRNPGFWQVLGESVFLVVISQLTLACWAWTGGFVLGAVSRKMVQTNCLLLSLTLLLGAAVGAPLYEAFYGRYLHRSFAMPSFPDPNAPVFALVFYRQVLPIIVQAISVVMPAVWGIREGAGVTSFRRMLRMGLWTAAIASLMTMVAQNPDIWIFLRVPMRQGFPQSWPGKLREMVVYWPVVFLVAITIGRLPETKATLNRTILRGGQKS